MQGKHYNKKVWKTKAWIPVSMKAVGFSSIVTAVWTVRSLTEQTFRIHTWLLPGTCVLSPRTGAGSHRAHITAALPALPWGVPPILLLLVISVVGQSEESWAGEPLGTNQNKRKICLYSNHCLQKTLSADPQSLLLAHTRSSAFFFLLIWSKGRCYHEYYLSRKNEAK